MHVPEEEKYLNTEAELRDRLVSILGGRAAEEIVFDTVTTGAANDIEKATDIAKAMITQYGMSKRFGLMGLATVQNKYLDGSATLNCSDVTAAAVDDEVKDMLKESYEQALSLLQENRDVMDKLAEFLIEKETITGKEFMKIFREIKGIPEPEEEKKEEKISESAESSNEESSKEVTKEDESPAETSEDVEKEAEISTETSEEEINEVEMSTESFEELFQMAKEAVETDLENTEEENSKLTDETADAIDDKTEETKTTVRGNYSNASVENLWKDLK